MLKIYHLCVEASTISALHLRYQTLQSNYLTLQRKKHQMRLIKLQAAAPIRKTAV